MLKIKKNLKKEKTILMKNFNKNLKIIKSDIISAVYRAKKGHLGGSLSSVDIIYYLYSKKIVETFLGKPTKNSFILSKGHSSLALLSVVNFVNKNKYKSYLNKFNLDGSLSGNNCSEKVPGFEFHTGSLGHGVGLACGVALAKKKKNVKGKTIVLISDGELHEGSIFEGLLFADQHKLDLTVIIDNNSQICEGYTKNIIHTKKFIRFLKNNFQSIQIDGHKLNELKKIDNLLKKKGLKIAILNTIKGKGIKFMENVIRWHHSVPNKKEYINALKDLS